jgi:hypothetical protein
MILPTIHLNGSAPEALLNAARKAAELLREAEAALAEMAPNGRDYYLQGEAAWGMAQAQHRARIEALRATRVEVEAFWLDLDERIDSTSAKSR